MTKLHLLQLVGLYAEKGLSAICMPTDQGDYEPDDSTTIRIKVQQQFGMPSSSKGPIVVADKADSEAACHAPSSTPPGAMCDCSHRIESIREASLAAEWSGGGGRLEAIGTGKGGRGSNRGHGWRRISTKPFFMCLHETGALSLHQCVLERRGVPRYPCDVRGVPRYPCRFGLRGPHNGLPAAN